LPKQKLIPVYGPFAGKQQDVLEMFIADGEANFLKSLKKIIGLFLQFSVLRTARCSLLSTDAAMMVGKHLSNTVRTFYAFDFIVF
jgi:hypothetical protein